MVSLDYIKEMVSSGKPVPESLLFKSTPELTAYTVDVKFPYETLLEVLKERSDLSYMSLMVENSIPIGTILNRAIDNFHLQAQSDGKETVYSLIARIEIDWKGFLVGVEKKVSFMDPFGMQMKGLMETVLYHAFLAQLRRL